MNKPALKLWEPSPELRFFCRLKTPVRPELVEGLGMVRQAHHERVSGAGSPRTGRSNGLTTDGSGGAGSPRTGRWNGLTTNGWFDRLTTNGSAGLAHHGRISGGRLTTNGSVERAHCERMVRQAHHGRISGAGSPRTDQWDRLSATGSVGQVFDKLTPAALAALASKVQNGMACPCRARARCRYSPKSAPPSS